MMCPLELLYFLNLTLAKPQKIAPSHHVKMDLDKKSGPDKKRVQNLIVDAKGFSKTMN